MKIKTFHYTTVRFEIKQTTANMQVRQSGWLKDASKPARTLLLSKNLCLQGFVSRQRGRTRLNTGIIPQQTKNGSLKINMATLDYALLDCKISFLHITPTSASPRIINGAAEYFFRQASEEFRNLTAALNYVDVILDDLQWQDQSTSHNRGD